MTLYEIDNQVEIQFSDLKVLSGTNAVEKKLFNLALIKANEQAFFNGSLTRTLITFPLQLLVDKGMYESTRAARRGFLTGMETLASQLKIRGEVKTKGKESNPKGFELLFTGACIEKGQCKIYLNERLDWSFIIQYFTLLPPY